MRGGSLADLLRGRRKGLAAQRIEHAGTVDHQLRLVQQMSDAELLDAAPAEWRELVE